eukprot:461125-Rhodomonas_salina.1
MPGCNAFRCQSPAPHSASTQKRSGADPIVCTAALIASCSTTRDVSTRHGERTRGVDLVAVQPARVVVEERGVVFLVDKHEQADPAAVPVTEDRHDQHVP